MPALSDVEGLLVKGPSGKELGSVQHVLFHPTEPRAVGLMVAVPPLAMLVARKPRFILLDAGVLRSCGEGGYVEWASDRLPARAETEKALGHSWDETVIWRHMPARLPGGERVGTVSDLVFSRKTGSVLRMTLSEGAAVDIAVGRTEVPGELVEGFRGDAVLVDPAFRDLPPSGGLAAAAGTGAVKVKQGAETAADAVLAAGVVGLEAVERSFKRGWGRRAMRALRKARGTTGRRS